MGQINKEALRNQKQIDAGKLVVVKVNGAELIHEWLWKVGLNFTEKY